MTRSEPVVDSPHDVSIAAPTPRRVRVRRRRSHAHDRHNGTRQWTARRSRRRIIRAVVVSAAMLAVMAVGLYIGLSRQELAPGHGTHAKPGRAVSQLA
jgi:anti-sigma-K factor RskA